MDPFVELERMASNVAQNIASEIHPEEIARWQRLFSYSYEQAMNLIDQHNKDFTRAQLTDSQWEMIRNEFESRGYDRSSWEHELSLGRNRAKGFSSNIPAKIARKLYLLKLEARLDTPASVALAAGLLEPPEYVQGESDDGNEVGFCIVDGLSKQKILEWVLLNVTPAFKPTFAPFNKASKDFSSCSIHPTLGIESTLPQHRACENTFSFEPSQNQYPVWYFFYGTLTQGDVLSCQLSLPDQETPTLYPATISQGRLETWGGRYKALVDAPHLSNDSKVHGAAYQVTSREHEDALRVYETDNYEVVRCSISINFRDRKDDRAVKGCTFRFIGPLDKA